MLRRHWTRRIVWTALTVVLAGLLTPVFVSLNFWHAGIAAALSSGLGRPVRTGAIHLKLFGGPGFEIDRVIVEEDPRFGAEPFVRMETLRATLALKSLFRRRMQFSSLVFVHPSLNVVRNADGHWNLETLSNLIGHVSPVGGSSAQKRLGGASAQLPIIHIDTGRINFKYEDYKKSYIVDPIDMEIAAPSSASEPWRVRFDGRPNRTDMPFNSDTRFTGQAELGPFGTGFQKEAGALARIDLNAENAILGDWLRAFTGNDHGVHGSMNVHLRLAGTTSLMRLSGSADLSDLHRWDLLPPPSASVLRGEIAAILDLQKDSLDLQSFSVPFSDGWLVVQGEIQNVLHHPRPELQGQLHGVPLRSIVEIAKEFTTRLDSRFTAQGSVEGRLEIKGSPDTFAVSLSVTEGQIQENGTPQVARLSNFKVMLSGLTGRAGPVKVSFGEGGSLDSSAEWDIERRELNVHLQSDGVRLPSLLPWARSIGSRWGQANITRGNAAMRVNIAAWEGKVSEITGSAQVTNALINSASVNEPIRVPGAVLQFQPGSIRVKPFSALLGRLELHGSFTVRLNSPEPPDVASALQHPPIEFDIQTSKIDIAELDRLLNPSYRNSPFSIFGAEVGRRSPFFARLAAEGVIQADSLNYGNSAIRNFKAAIGFRKRRLELTSFTGDFAGGTQSGDATIDFNVGPPGFVVQSRFASIDLAQFASQTSVWSGMFSGKLSGILRLAGSGWNLPEILESLGGSGEAAGSNLEINGIDLRRIERKSEGVTQIASLSSKFQIAKKEVRLVYLRMSPATKFARSEHRFPQLLITGAVGFDHSLDLVVSEKGEAQTYHWGGTVAEPLVGETAAVLRPISE